MFAVIGVDHEDDGNGDDNEKCCDDFAYSCQQLQPHSVFVLSLPCFFMSCKDNFTEIRSGLHISIFDILFANEVLYRSYVLRHHLLLSVLCS